MKKFLSLVLALVMTMSLVTISAGAKDFDDNADITYVEAVDVMSDLKIVDGDLAGNFNPTNGLTRGAAAKIICNLILGPTTAAELNANTNPFPDVDKDSVYAGYIAYCANEGIVGGYADGNFKPANPLTGYAFMKMLLGALGYDPAVEGYAAPNWSINVAKQAIGIGLNAGLVDEFNGSDYVTREEAMLYAFNTMKATMVDYDTTITIGDITVAGSNEYEVANNARTETIKDDNKMQFAEKYFSKLSLDTDVADWAGRPCNKWINGKEEIGTYVDYTLLVAEYTTAVTGKDLYDVVGGTAYEDYDFVAYVDGEDSNLCDKISKNNKGEIAESGNGVLLQVFVNNDTKSGDVIVTVINTYLAKANDDYNAKKDSVSFNVYGTSDTNAYVSGEDFDVADIKEGDFVLVNYDKVNDEIVEIMDVETIEDTEIQKFTKGSSLTVDGDKYNYSEKATYDPAVLDDYTGITNNGANLKDVTYNIYVDQYGYVIGVEEVTAPNNYLFITGADSASSNLSNKTWDANAIFMDGTSAVIEVKATDDVDNDPIINAWFSYTVNNAGVYTVEKVNDQSAITVAGATEEIAQNHNTEGDLNGKKIDDKHISMKGIGNDNKVYGNDNTVYLLADLEKVTHVEQNGKVDYTVISGVDEVVTGVDNAAFTVFGWTEARAEVKATNGTASDDTVSYGAYPLYKDNGYIAAAVVVGESATVSSSIAYVHSSNVSSESYDKVNSVWTWTRDVVIDGEEVELVETNDSAVSALKNDNDMRQYNWVRVKYYADGTVKEVESFRDAGKYVNTIDAAVQRILADEEFIVLDGNSQKEYAVDGKTLYDVNDRETGFRVAEDVKVVLTQTNKNKTTTTYDVGISALKATLADLNEAKGVNYWFDAVIEDGRATVVIIDDQNKNTTVVGPDGSAATDAVVKVDTTLREITIVNTGKGLADVEAAIKVALADAGYTWTKVDGSGNAWIVEAFATTSAVNGNVVPFTVK